MRTRLQTILNKAASRALSVVGFEMRRKGQRSPSRHFMPSWTERLWHARKLGLFPKVAIDGGAFHGLWSRDLAAIFPGCQIVLIEPNPFVQDTLRQNISRIEPPPIVCEVALGESQGNALLNIWRDESQDTGASLLDHVSGPARKVIQVKVDTLDSLSERFHLSPDLIKLDLQGGELMALRGGVEVLNHAELVIVEFGVLRAYLGRSTPKDILDFMYDKDYCLYDIVDCHYRPFDGALAGGDFFFAKNWSVLRKYRGWE